MAEQMPVTASKGPNGLIEIRQANGVQGWHSGYVTPQRARALAEELLRVADQVERGE